MTEERIIELEIKLSYQDELLESLNSIVARQQKQIDMLEETCKLLHEKIKTLSIPEIEAQNTLLDELPPHY